jgi:hypothetical protein
MLRLYGIFHSQNWNFPGESFILSSSCNSVGDGAHNSWKKFFQQLMLTINNQKSTAARKVVASLQNCTQKSTFGYYFRCPNKFPYLCERSAWSDQAPRPVTTTATTTTTTTTVTTTTKEPVPPCTSLTLPARHTFLHYSKINLCLFS